MKTKVLLTSFDIWEPHHKSNSSDDLLGLISVQKLTNYSLSFLRKLPVDSQLATQIVIAKIEEIQPDVIICCGMAETRKILTIESQASCGEVVMKTSINLAELVAGLDVTEISNDAGKFVCEDLYYSVLKYLDMSCYQSKCIFVHVPVLTENNRDKIVGDFMKILLYIV
ncbi:MULTISPECIES: peptidase C15 [Okeania]|uniref:Peptidase C15 n=2 Tax=Okeania TaxID=1458928 RepID=A0A3N6Q0Y9_9CYAN|nr:MULTISPECIES: peptidase C15 [Okeania]NET16570.1 peptidase C15 [Okeania sp. SIO1H6]NES74799.1 peptidase C15 [Okeania sp. SIO1H4]NET18946.1 peptidase C15 [Okeania sp. SIO1H5]NET77626.1 peptidase C15 [Okeania sp. SIO1F9]NET94414.1 peptidase C15 [Okeania sp. SIO1H2]